METAIGCLLRLTESTSLELQIKAAVLLLSYDMPAFQASKLLSRYRNLRDSPQWATAAVHALRPDDDPAYRDLGDRERDEILRSLAIVPQQHLKDHVDELLALGRSRLDYNIRWAWDIAEVVSLNGLFQEAADLAKSVLESVPRTTEKRSLLLRAAQVSASFELEAAIARGDEKAVRETQAHWSELEEEATQDEQENQNARWPFL